MKLNFTRNLQAYHMVQVVLWLRNNPVIYMKINKIDNILTHYINKASVIIPILCAYFSGYTVYQSSNFISQDTMSFTMGDFRPLGKHM